MCNSEYAIQSTSWFAELCYLPLCCVELIAQCSGLLLTSLGYYKKLGMKSNKIECVSRYSDLDSQVFSCDSSGWFRIRFAQCRRILPSLYLHLEA